jgi:hypothetical protein
MADAGDLGKLPPEIRKEIYTYLLAEDIIIPIKHFYHFQGAENRCKPDTVALRLEEKRSSGVLRVNKLIKEEAVQVLYGYNKFEFMDAGVLHQFLGQIGDAKRHLRHVTMCRDGLVFMGSWKLMEQSIQMLASVKGLRTLEVPHSTLCRIGTLTNKIQIKELVQHCKPLLAALNDHFIKNDLGASVFDIIKIPVPLGVCKLLSMCNPKVEHPRMVFITDHAGRRHLRKMTPLQCHCACKRFEDEDNKLEQELKEEIAKQLKLDLP